MGKIFDIIDYIFEWMCDFYYTRTCDVLKLGALWGLIIILLGTFFHSGIMEWIGIVLCSGFVLAFILSAVFIMVSVLILIINGIFAYTERVLFGENKFFE